MEVIRQAIQLVSDMEKDMNDFCFHVFVTTKRLLRTAILFSTHVCSDGINNPYLICQGFPVLMCGIKYL